MTYGFSYYLDSHIREIPELKQGERKRNAIPAKIKYFSDALVNAAKS